MKHTARGFTLIELMVVVAIIAIASAGVGFALRDSGQTALEREADRLAALFESARARSRANGVPVLWRPTPEGFRFEGLPRGTLPERWLNPATAVPPQSVALLGPDPIIGPQQVVLFDANRPDRALRIATDGVRPFAVLPAQ